MSEHQWQLRLYYLAFGISIRFIFHRGELLVLDYPPFAQFGYERASVATVHGSIYPAVQNIMLACRTLGIGTVITTIHCCFEEDLQQKLGIPGEMEVSALLPLGYPQGHFGPTRRQSVETVIHWDRWQQKQ